jgi:hypothetical protein
VDQNGLCGAHLRRWRKLGGPPAAELAGEAQPAAARPCTVDGCLFLGPPGWTLCDAHHRSWVFLRRSHPAMDERGYVAHLAQARARTSPRYDVRGLPPIVRLELQFALQVRHDQRAAMVHPAAFRALVRWLARAGVTSMLDESDGWWQHSAAEHLAGRMRGPALALARYARRALGDLRDAAAGEVWTLDVWPVARIDLDGRWSHQTVGRISFVAIEPGWVRELAKRWARWRLSTATKSPSSIAGACASLRHFTRWLSGIDALPQDPSQLTREVLERYLAWLAASGLSAARTPSGAAARCGSSRRAVGRGSPRTRAGP